MHEHETTASQETMSAVTPLLTLDRTSPCHPAHGETFAAWQDTGGEG
jgi:hypothetical protein